MPRRESLDWSVQLSYRFRTLWPEADSFNLRVCNKWFSMWSRLLKQLFILVLNIGQGRKDSNAKRDVTGDDSEHQNNTGDMTI